MHNKPTQILTIATVVILGGLGLMQKVASAEEQPHTLPQYSTEKHMGVATCANSMCHGVRILSERSNVRQNEYHTWLFNDRHSKAYTTLLSDESKRIAQKLGLEDASTAGICLDCHADNVPQDKRGPEFHISDGVGCEACHGGAENYIGTHTITPYDQARNIKDGMYPTGSISSRTLLCTSCHVGTSEKLANHNIMGAGHPRLSFELDTFIARQPVHYDVDKDYIERKGKGIQSTESPISRMLIGTALFARANAENLNSKLLDHPQGFPEIALFNCHSCHKSLNSQTWEPRPRTSGLKPGSIRLNDGSFILLAALSGAIDKRLQNNILSGTRQLHKASLNSTQEVKTVARSLIQLTKQAEVTFSRIDINQEIANSMLKEIAQFGANGEYTDYIAAEQALMSMSAISHHFPGNVNLENFINQAYKLTGNDERYQAAKMKRLMRDYLTTNY